ncbi:MAG TPA: oligosaccharide flippase family protein [Kofleriaceae bacterium]|jgi:PST family polysaccharide transporter|nr:oligosaccharide flippase family protein [Kofleriaceae bacterium]
MSIAKQAAHGVAWNMVFGVGSRVLQLVGTLWLTRVVAPHAYGDVIMASIVVATASAFTSFSFGQYMIAKKAPAEVAAQAMAIHMVLGVVAMTATYALREPLGHVVHARGMGQYVLGFAIAQLIDRSRYVPERLLMRAMRFRALATINGLGEIGFTIAALATMHWLGAYAIMLATIVRSVITSALFFYAAPRSEWMVRVRFRASDVRALIGYGLPIMVAIVTDTATRRWDNVVVNGLFDTSVMALYQLAYSLAEMPIINVAEHIGEVLMPAFSRMETGQRERAAIRAAALMGLIVSPLGVGLGVIAPTVAATIFDDKWQPMGPLLRILSVMTVFRPMTWSAIAYVQAVQRTRIVMWSSFIRAIVVLSLVGVGGELGGINGACFGAGAGFAVHSVLTIIATSRATGLSASAYLGGCMRSLLPCIPMYFAVEAISHTLAAVNTPNIVSLIAQIVAGAIIYIGAAFILVRPSVNELLRIGRDAIRRRR